MPDIMDWTALERLLAAQDRFLVTTHVRPDGDALGSALAMAAVLRQRGKDVRIVVPSPTPPRYAFLDPDGSQFEQFGIVARPDSLGDRQAIVILDLSSWGQLGEMADFVRDFRGPSLVIDHHVSQDDMGAIAYLKDCNAEATGALVHRAAKVLGAQITPEIALALLTALVMDTGWFRHPTTTPATLRMAADLFEAGADLPRLYRLLFERNTTSRLLLTGRALSGLRTAAGGRIAWVGVTQGDLAETGAIPAETEDLVDHTVSIEGVEIGFMLVEQRDARMKVSLRSRAGFDCAEYARSLGGGGHKAAAGAMVDGPVERAAAQVVAGLSALLVA